MMPTKTAEIQPAKSRKWRNGWTPENPIQFTFSHQPVKKAVWTDGTFPFLKYRDLLLGKASSGRISATQVRATGKAGQMRTDWHHYDLDFDFFYVTRGSAKIETEGGQQLTLTAKSSGLQPPGLRHNIFDISEDFEAVIIRVPAFVEPSFGRDGETGRRGQYQIYSPDLYLRGDQKKKGEGSIIGLRDYIAYRQFGVMEATEGRINIHESMVVAPPPAGGTGWHKHMSSNWYLMLSGQNEDGFENEDTFIFSAGDVFCQGPGTAHVAGYNSADCAVLGVAIPASYNTVPLPTPPGFRFKFAEGGGK